jgi:hypothetical protein
LTSPGLRNEAGVKRALLGHGAAWVLWWIPLFWLWLLLAGDWNRIEWIAAASAAAVAATLAELGRSAAGITFRVPVRQIGASWNVLPMVLVDFGIVMWALFASIARGRVVRGTFRVHEFEAHGETPFGASLRAWTTIAAGYSPNAFVVDIDPDRNLVLVHDLVPFTRSEEPAA